MLHATKIAELKLWEFFVLDIPHEIAKFQQGMLKLKPAPVQFIERHPRELVAHIPPELGARFKRSVPVELALAYLTPHLHKPADEITREWKTALEILNLIFYEEYDRELIIILANIKQRAAYCRLDEGGPRLGTISAE